jgi:ADP-ribosylglycohydrolase
MTRRDFLGTSAGLAVAGSAMGQAGGAGQKSRAVPPDLEDRIRGLLFGSFIGDALGGPTEFQPMDRVWALEHPPKRWREGERLDAAARMEAGERLLRQWRGYEALRPDPEPYAHWTSHAPAGTITDDSRHKLILLRALRGVRRRGRLDAAGMARAFLDWSGQGRWRSDTARARLNVDWLKEWNYAARWVLGERDIQRARPPERMWNGLPTCCGQMTSLPLAAVFAGEPTRAYRAAFEIGFFDNGWGRDLNACLVSGLAQALVTDPDLAAQDRWTRVTAAMTEVDPFGYRDIPWCRRAVDRWSGVSDRLVAAARGEPARLFAGLEQEFSDTIKWEAQVPFVVVMACWKLAEADPRAALMLSLEWGHDTDSYAQLAGAFAGALHGVGLFPESWRRTLVERVATEYGMDLEEEVRLLMELNREGLRRDVVG